MIQLEKAAKLIRSDVQWGICYISTSSRRFGNIQCLPAHWWLMYVPWNQPRQSKSCRNRNLVFQHLQNEQPYRSLPVLMRWLHTGTALHPSSPQYSDEFGTCLLFLLFPPFVLRVWNISGQAMMPNFKPALPLALLDVTSHVKYSGLSLCIVQKKSKMRSCNLFRKFRSEKMFVFSM